MTQDSYMSLGRIHSRWSTFWAGRCAPASTATTAAAAATSGGEMTDWEALPLQYAFRTLGGYEMHTDWTGMTQDRSTPLPTELARAPMKTIRPLDAAHYYAHPRAQLARLSERGLLHRLADGYYVVVPQDMVGNSWMPGLETAAAGIASAIYGPDSILVMGISAARLHRAIPRALATATIAVPDQHRRIALSDRPAAVRFIKRDTKRLDAERYDTELGPTLVTTPEQTILDLANRPKLGDAEIDVPIAVAALYERSDKDRLQALATEQKRTASLKRAETWARQ